MASSSTTTPVTVTEKKADAYEKLVEEVTRLTAQLNRDQARSQELAALEKWAAGLRELAGSSNSKQAAAERDERERRRIQELRREIEALKESKDLSGKSAEVRQLEINALTARVDAAKDTLKHYTRSNAVLEVKKAELTKAADVYVVAEWRARSSPAFPQSIGKTPKQSSDKPAWSKSLPFEFAQSPADPASLVLHVYESGLLSDSLIGVGEWEIKENEDAWVAIHTKDAVPVETDIKGADGVITREFRYAPADVKGKVQVQVVPGAAPKFDASVVSAAAEPKSSRGCWSSIEAEPSQEKNLSASSPANVEHHVHVAAPVPAAPGVVPVLDTPQPPPAAPKQPAPAL